CKRGGGGGGPPWRKLVTASTKTLKVDWPSWRQVWRSDKVRSTHWLPWSLSVPLEPLRPITAKRQDRSARLLVGSTPCSARKTHSEAISRCKRLVKRPASSARSWERSIKRHHRAYHARHSPPLGGALAIWHKPWSSFRAHMPQADSCGSCVSESRRALRMRWAKHVWRDCTQC